MFATCSTILLPKNTIPRIPSPTNYDTSTLSENYCPAKIYQIQIHVPMYGINTNQPPSPLLGWWSRLLHPSTVRAHGKRGKEGRKERREKRSKGRDESLGGRDLGSPFSRIHTARFLSRSPSPHPRPGSCPRGGGWRPPTETPFLPPLTHMPRRTCNMCTRMHVYPSRGTGFSVCVCVCKSARARDKEEEVGWLCSLSSSPLFVNALCKSFSTFSSSSYTYSYSCSPSFSISRDFLRFPFFGRTRKEVEKFIDWSRWTFRGHSWRRGRYLEFVEFSSGMFPF